MFLVYHDLKQKNKIRCFHAKKFAFTHRNLFKMYMKSLDSYAIIESRATRHSAVSALTETVTSMLMSFLKNKTSPLSVLIYLTVYLYFFSKHNWFAETHSYLKLSYQITDRLLILPSKQTGKTQTSIQFVYPPI